MASEHQHERGTSGFASPVIWLIVAVVLFVALVYRHGDLFLLAAMVLLLMIASKTWSLISLSRVYCSVRLDKERAFPQETVTLTTQVENAKILPIWVRIHWPGNNVLSARNETADAFQESGLLWYQRARFHQHLTALRRGVYEVGPSHIRTSDIFGLFISKKELNEIVKIIVYPRLVALRPIELPRHDLFGKPGNQSPVKDPVYVMGTNDYQPSRPSRHIHWKASAKHLRLQEKQFEPSAQGKVMAVLDAVAFEKNEAADPFEYTLEVMASLILQWTNMGMTVGFMTNAATQGIDVKIVPAGRSPQQLSAILEVLARMQMRPRAELSQVMQQGLASQRGVHYAYFCYETGPGSQEMRKICRERRMPLTVFAWRFDPVSRPTPNQAAAKIHLIDNVRLHREAAS